MVTSFFSPLPLTLSTLLNQQQHRNIVVAFSDIKIYGLVTMSAKRRAKPTPETVTVDMPLTGRDEMNLAEFPLSVLTDRTPKATKTLIFHNQHGSLTITSSDAYGLPTALDADVIVGMIQLTKQKNDFKEPIVNFTRYELIRLLGWPNEGKSYHRLEESLNRWHGVSLFYDGCWWDNRARRYGDAKIHIIESVVILEGTGKTGDDGMQQSLPLSSFEWNKRFIESCQADNLKYLDLSFYFSLEHPSSKRLYRFLDKRFYLRPEWEFDLAEIAFERVGLSRNYADAGKIKEKLQPAIEELEGKAFLRPMSRDERYVKEGKCWKVRFIQQPLALPAPPPSQPEAEPEPPLAAELARRGVTARTAAELVQDHPAEIIEAKIGVFDWLVEKQDKRVAKSPADYLVKSITDDYAPPKGFASRAERERQAEAQRQAERKAAEASRREREQEAHQQERYCQADVYWSKLTPTEQADVEAKALAAASESDRNTYLSVNGRPGSQRLANTLLAGIRREYILSRIDVDAMAEPA